MSNHALQHYRLYPAEYKKELKALLGQVAMGEPAQKLLLNLNPIKILAALEISQICYKMKAQHSAISAIFRLHFLN